MFRLLHLLFYFVAIQIEFIINIIIFIILYIYKNIYKLFKKPNSNLDKFKTYINNNKLNIIQNLLLFILNPSSTYYYITCLGTILILFIKDENNAIFNIVTLLMKSCYLALTGNFFISYLII